MTAALYALRIKLQLLREDKCLVPAVLPYRLKEVEVLNSLSITCLVLTDVTDMLITNGNRYLHILAKISVHEAQYLKK